MDLGRQLITVELNGTRYRGAYSLDGENLVVEAYGLGRKLSPASLVDYVLDEAARKLAQLMFAELIKENMDVDPDVLQLIAQGSTTQIPMIGTGSQSN